MTSNTRIINSENKNGASITKDLDEERNKIRLKFKSLGYTELDQKNIKIWQKRLKNVKIILFDWDGTINRDDLKHFATEKAYVKRFKLSEKYGITATDIHFFKGIEKAKIRGPRARRSGFQYLHKRLGRRINPIKLFFMYLFYEFYYAYNALLSEDYKFFFDDVEDLLLKLKKAGYILGVATNKDVYVVKLQIKRSRIRKVFSSMLGASSLVKIKPAPDMILRSIGIINRKVVKKGEAKLSAKNVLMVGDNPFDDIKAGSRAGCFTCLVNSSLQKLEDLNRALKKGDLEIIPNLNLRHIADLEKILISKN
ncbi:MAG: HAD family hydrolase [Promethearchaeota archaeon]